MIKRFKDMLLDFNVKFPMKKNDYGFYTADYTEHGHNLRCPNCGTSLWSIKNYQHLECINCYKNYNNLGVLGLAEIQELN